MCKFMYEQFKFLHLWLYCGLLYGQCSFKVPLLKQVVVYKINGCRFYNRLGDTERFHPRLPVDHEPVLLISPVTGMKLLHAGRTDILPELYEPVK